MKIEEKFNKRAANLIEVQPPSIKANPHLALGIKATFYRLPGEEASTIAMHLTPDEALAMAVALTEAARKLLRA